MSRLFDPGAPMSNRLILSVVVPGQTFTLGSVTYQGSMASPPTGAPGNVWVTLANGGDRQNLVNAFNGVLDPLHIVYNGIHPDRFTAQLDPPSILVWASTRAGNGMLRCEPVPAPVGATGMMGADGWDDPATCQGGRSPSDPEVTALQLLVTAEMVTHGSTRLRLPFLPARMQVTCRTFPAFADVCDAAAIAGTPFFELTLAGGGHAGGNLDAGDLLDLELWDR
jgi:hypothetical protein